MTQRIVDSGTGIKLTNNIKNSHNASKEFNNKIII